MAFVDVLQAGGRLGQSIGYLHCGGLKQGG